MQEPNKPVKGDTRKYKWTSCVTLTKPEGEALDRIISDNECSNLSQLCKKIAQGTLKLW